MKNLIFDFLFCNTFLKIKIFMLQLEESFLFPDNRQFTPQKNVRICDILALSSNILPYGPKCLKINK